jgi:DNA-binding transcriptional LysR family regulator
MAELERQLGARLFHRHARGVKLSPSGDQFRARAKDILAQIEDGRSLNASVFNRLASQRNPSDITAGARDS